MCGIAGIVSMGGAARPCRQDLELMVASLHHRGPDGRGYFVEGPVGLGHARLSIIDLVTGDQPISNEDGSVTVIFNGEIFNYLELRDELIARGHRFRTCTDTEVIVHLYEERGPDFVTALNGQFAIAIWDASRERLVLTRDRPGILPLFYSHASDRLLFASEIKALLPLLNGRPQLNREALDQLFTFWAPVSPGTLFDGVFELAPGMQMIVEAGAVRQRRYWQWDFPEPGHYVSGSEGELVEQAHDLLLDATRIRLRADVPVGAYLSGGLDSSILTALISRHENASLRTFSIEFARDDLDESNYQRLMSEHLGVECTSVRCQEMDIATALPDVIRHTEIPLLRTAPVPMGLLSELVRSENFKVVLTGEGADEVFGGYDLFKEVKLRQFWARNPESVYRPQLLKRLYPYLDLSKAQDNVYLKRFFGAGLEAPDQPLFSHLTRAANTSQCKVFFADEFREGLRSDPLQELEQTLPDAFGRWSPFNRAQFIEARSLMAGYLLSSQGDRMLMRNSVEGRFPYLDHRVIEFANTLDPRLKMKVLNEKYVLKKAFGSYLPDSIVKRYKQPYRAPDVPAFFSGAGHEYVRDMLCAAAVDRVGIFDSGKVQRLVNKMERGGSISNRDNMSFVGVLSTQIWHEEFINHTRASSSIKPATAAEN